MEQLIGQIATDAGEGTPSIQDPISRIQSQYKTYTKLEKKIATFFINHYNDLHEYSITTLAKKIGTNPTAVTRFCQSLHYTGFGEFKYCLANALLFPPGSQLKVTRKDSINEIKKKLIHLDIEAVYDSLVHIDPLQIQAVVYAVNRAKKIYLYAEGGPGASAQFAHSLFLQIGIICHVYTDTQLAEIAATQLTEEDTIIFICRAGAGIGMERILQQAQKNRATIIGITSAADSVLARVSKVCLCYSFRIENDLRYLHIARMCELAIIGLIQSALINQMPEERARRQLESKEILNRRKFKFKK